MNFTKEEIELILEALNMLGGQLQQDNNASKSAGVRNAIEQMTKEVSALWDRFDAYAREQLYES